MRLIDPEQITKMMSDLYISKDAVNMTGEYQGLWVRFRAIEKAVSEIPTIDAVEVVRCENCIFYEKALSVQGFCHNHGSIVSANAFCSYGSYGKHREDGEK